MKHIEAVLASTFWQFSRFLWKTTLKTAGKHLRIGPLPQDARRKFISKFFFKSMQPVNAQLTLGFADLNPAVTQKGSRRQPALQNYWAHSFGANSQQTLKTPTIPSGQTVTRCSHQPKASVEVNIDHAGDAAVAIPVLFLGPQMLGWRYYVFKCAHINKYVVLSLFSI